MYVVKWKQISHGNFFDNYTWEMFKGKLSLLILLTMVSWSASSLISVALIWMRTKIEETNGRFGITALLFILILGSQNWTLLNIIFPFEVIRFMCFSLPYILPQIRARITFPLPSYVNICMDNLEDSWLIIFDTIAIVIPGKLILYLYPFKVLPERIQTSKLMTCTLCKRESKNMYLMENCSHNLCLNCAFPYFAKYSRCKMCENTYTAISEKDL